ncbi:MAG TPA: hypothetical protein VKA86_08215 [Candidatus Krumholzibacteria bacterium]|nr:hypothetical protein [Candidatus Krumholzibacteria bacterium]
MKVLVPIVLLVLLPGLAWSQAEPGDAGFFADAEGTLSAMPADVGTVQSVYVVAFDLPTPLFAYEFGVDGLLESGAIVLSLTVPWPFPPITDPDYDSVVVGTGSCVEATGAVMLARIDFFVPAPIPDDTAVCLTGSDPSSFPDGRPGWQDCEGEIHPFTPATDGGEAYPDACVILNATLPNPFHPVDATASSFGALKARF